MKNVYTLQKQADTETLCKDGKPVICSCNAQPFIGSVNAIGQPVMSQFFCGNWCNRYNFQLAGIELIGKEDYEGFVEILCGCKSIKFPIEKSKSPNESKILNINKD